MSGTLAVAGVLVAAGAAAASILLPPGRLRSIAMLVAIALFPILILGDQWHTAQIADLRHHPDRFLALGLAALATTVALATVFHRSPTALPLAIVAALPFRIPLTAGGDTANLLVPLYLVIAGGVLATTFRDWTASRGNVPGPVRPAAAWLPRILAAVVVVYALQALYSPDFSKALQNVCFFFVPFTVAYGLLGDFKWDRRLLRMVLWVVAIEALAFVLIGSVEYLTRDLFWNDQVIRSNEFHTYFRVNSVFWDPNVYGRYLALVIVVAMAALLWARERRTFALLTALVGVLWLGLVPTFSQSSFIALLAGLAVLAALRWSWKWTLGAVAIGAVATMLVVTVSGGFDFSRVNIDTSGRANLVSGGLDLFGERPVWGYGSGSFQAAYKDHAASPDAPVSVSHTEPITVAAEQGLVGLSLYAALIAVALWSMTTGLGSSLPGLNGRHAGHPPPAAAIARAAVLAAFVALIVHTMAYAGFFEDPITWVLLAVGASLAAGAAVRDPA